MKRFSGMMGFVVVILFLTGITGCGQAEAAVKRNIRNSDELQEALKEPGEMVLYLQNNIELGRRMDALGKKVINGGGRYYIRRKVDKESRYVGTLLCAKGKLLSLQGVTLEGCGRRKETPDEIRGRLLEVKSGTVVLDAGTILRENYNLTWQGNGGGGIWIGSGGRVIMKRESRISDNLTMRDGAGVRIERGGVLVMEGGTICDNAVVGQSVQREYDGRGGGVYNEGTLIFRGGRIYGNIARAYQREGIRYGGKGNEIYSVGTLSLDGSGKVASVYLESGSKINLGTAWEQAGMCRLVCEDAAEGRVVVQAMKGCPGGWERSFVWGGNTTFTLEKNKISLRLHSKAKRKKEKNVKKKSAKKQPIRKPAVEPKAETVRKPTVKPVVEPTMKPTVEATTKQALEATTNPSVEPAITPSEELTSPTRIPTVETQGVSAYDGRIQFVQDASGKGVSEQSVWHLPEYAQLLRQTFQKDFSMYEQVWEIRAEKISEMRNQIRENRNQNLIERCDTFLRCFGREKIQG